MGRLIIRILALVLASLVLTGGLFGVSLLAHGERSTLPLENIHSVPFPVQGGVTLIDEHLAHTDVFLTEPVLGKVLTLNIAFRPDTANTLAVGVRQGPFWLSYTPTEFFHRTPTTVSSALQATRVQVPLSGAIQSNDQSVDVMFFTDLAHYPMDVDPAQADHTHWELASFKAEVSSRWPTATELRHYLGRLIRRDRPL